MTRIFSGMQPSGDPTLGNYLGAIRQWVDFQKQAEALFCIVDLHAITIPQDPADLRANSLEVAANYIACGIDPKVSSIFVQSAVPEHAELGWILSCITPLGWLNRMTQFKEKSGKHKENACLGLYAYPVLMAADILAYKATHVPVGEDQKQHLELARDIAGAFNRLYGMEFFPLPEPQIVGPTPRVMSLRDGTSKMSKSDPSDFSRIHLMDSNDEIAAKIRKAKTDPEPLPLEEKGLEGRAEAQNLVAIYGALAGLSVPQVLNQFGGQMFSSFKPALTEQLINVLAPIREDSARLLDQDRAYLEDCLRRGQDTARGIATKTVAEVKDIVGFLRV